MLWGTVIRRPSRDRRFAPGQGEQGRSQVAVVGLDQAPQAREGRQVDRSQRSRARRLAFAKLLCEHNSLCVLFDNPRAVRLRTHEKAPARRCSGAGGLALRCGEGYLFGRALSISIFGWRGSTARDVSFPLADQNAKARAATDTASDPIAIFLVHFARRFSSCSEARTDASTGKFIQ